MNDPTFIAWIDESGDDGDKFRKGSSEFLIISAVVGYDAMAVNVESAFEFARTAANKSKPWPKKFNRTIPTQQWLVCKTVRHLDFHAAHVLIHKPSIRNERLRADKNRLYSFGSKFLIERISWICRALDHPFAPGNRRCKIIFSEDRSRSYDAFKRYVRLLASDPQKHNTKTDWRYIDPDLIEWRPFKQDLGLLLADYHASALGLAAEYKMHDAHDDRFARILCECVFDADTSVLGNGYKFWPKDAEQLPVTDPRFSWMKQL